MVGNSDNKANSVQFQVKLPTGTELGNYTLKRADGSFISEHKEILEECRLFYKKLYSKNSQVDPDNFPFFCEHDGIPKLNEQQKNSCEIDLTEAELHKTLKSFSKNKSPGLDGITAEFYLCFWEPIKSKLLQV